MNGNGNGVREFIIENFLYGEAGQLREDTSFLGNSIIDSTGILELVSFLEEKFGIVVSDDEIVPENLDSLKNIDSYVSRKLNLPIDKETPVRIQYAENLAPFDPAKPGVVGGEANLL